MSKITLQTPVTVTPAVVVAELTIDRIIDTPSRKEVVAFIREIPRPIKLWEGAAYDAIGDWTQAQAEARILEVLS